MQTRVVTDRPWDVACDLLAIPYLGAPSFEGQFDEIDRRAGGELRSLVAFGELTAQRYAAAVAAAGDLPAGRLLPIAAGPADAFDREIAVRLGSAIERRLAGRAVRRLAIWLGDLPSALGGDVAAVAELLARGVVEGSFDLAGLYHDNSESAPPALDELVIVAPDAGANPGADAVTIAHAVERGVILSLIHI